MGVFLSRKNFTLTKKPPKYPELISQKNKNYIIKELGLFHTTNHIKCTDYFREIKEVNTTLICAKSSKNYIISQIGGPCIHVKPQKTKDDKIELYAHKIFKMPFDDIKHSRHSYYLYEDEYGTIYKYSDTGMGDLELLIDHEGAEAETIQVDADEPQYLILNADYKYLRCLNTMNKRNFKIKLKTNGVLLAHRCIKNGKAIVIMRDGDILLVKYYKHDDYSLIFSSVKLNLNYEENEALSSMAVCPKGKVVAVSTIKREYHQIRLFLSRIWFLRIRGPEPEIIEILCSICLERYRVYDLRAMEFHGYINYKNMVVLSGLSWNEYSAVFTIMVEVKAKRVVCLKYVHQIESEWPRKVLQLKRVGSTVFGADSTARLVYINL